MSLPEWIQLVLPLLSNINITTITTLYIKNHITTYIEITTTDITPIIIFIPPLLTTPCISQITSINTTTTNPSHINIQNIITTIDITTPGISYITTINTTTITNMNITNTTNTGHIMKYKTTTIDTTTIDITNITDITITTTFLY